MHSPLFIISLLITFFLHSPPGSATATTTAGKIHHHHHHHRRILHQPLFPVNQSVPPTSVPTITKPPIPKQFFPINLSPPPSPPPPPPITDADKTFPANISSLILPQTKSKPSTNKPISGKLIAIIISVSILSASLISAIFAFVFLRRRDGGVEKIYRRKFDSLRLVPPNSTPSHAEINKTTPYPMPRHESSSTSSEFLYLNTHVSSREVNNEYIAQSSTTPNDSVSINFQRFGIGSPELRPLPPLPRQHFRRSRKVGEVGSSEDDGEEEFFSPRGSSGDKGSPDFKNRSFNAPFEDNRFSCTNSNSPTDSALNSPPVTSNSPESLVNLSLERRGLSLSSEQILESPRENTGGSGRYVSVELPPSPPPPPPWRFWEAPIIPKPPTAENDGPSELVKPLRPVLCQNANDISNSSEGVEWRNKELKPKLKPLHWDKVRASSDRATVWDQLKSSSFQLNEEMIETLFTVNSSTLNSEDVVMRPIIPMMNQEHQVLDPKKSQNIAILLRALSVSTVEVCEALLEGNADKLGTQLLESLIKMAPTKEEEWKLKDLKDEPPFKLGPAEKFLKAVLDIPFAFKRVDAMLYIANFDSEVEYLKMSFKTLKNACEELRNSTKFLKLLEAVLKAGNRMNDGTNRGDACAFKLDTLLKLLHIKGADGKTTLLHFVVQQIIRAEECRLSGGDLNPDVENNQQSFLHDDVELRKIGVQVVSGLSLELTNVKKAAAIDSDILSNEVAKLAAGVAIVMDAKKLNEELVLNESSRKFSNSMNDFLKKAEEELINVQAQEGVALSMVKKLTEYFHGGLVTEEARPFRIFMIVKGLPLYP